MPLLKYTVYLFFIVWCHEVPKAFQMQELLCDFQHLWTTEPPWWFWLCCLLEALMNNSLYILPFFGWWWGTNLPQTYMARRALNRSLFHCRLALPDTHRRCLLQVCWMFTHKLGIWLCPIFFTLSSHFLRSFHQSLCQFGFVVLLVHCHLSSKMKCSPGLFILSCRLIAVWVHVQEMISDYGKQL